MIKRFIIRKEENALVSILCFVGGIVIGCIIGPIFYRCKSGYGRFKLEPYDSDEPDGFYKINVIIPQEQDLLKINTIVLLKDDSLK